MKIELGNNNNKEQDMKCRACDDILTDKEAVRKYPETEEFIDLCDECFVIAFELEEGEEDVCEMAEDIQILEGAV